ncbi:MAG: hypothetical protein FWG27_07190 [Treponema sp.]|nr:hypothetical protein [Treponema sp.]
MPKLPYCRKTAIDAVLKFTCPHFSCFALTYYFILGDNRCLSLKEFFDDEHYLELIANKTLPRLDSAGFEAIRSRLYDVWSLADADSLGEQALHRIQEILSEASRCVLTLQKIFSLGAESMGGFFIHDFMDAAPLDFIEITLILCVTVLFLV